MLGSICQPTYSKPASYFAPSKPSMPRGHPTPLSYLQEKGYSALIKIPFQCMMLMCDGLSALSLENLRLCISMLGQFRRQAVTNFALMAAESLFCSVSDAIQAKWHEADHKVDHEVAIQRTLDAPLIGDSVPVCGCPARGTDRHDTDVIYRTLQLYRATLSLDTWDEHVWRVTFLLLNKLSPCVHANPLTPPSLPDSNASAVYVLSMGPLARQHGVA